MRRYTEHGRRACITTPASARPVSARVFGDGNDKQSHISIFLRNNRVTVLKPESGNAPNVFYAGRDKLERGRRRPGDRQDRSLG